MSKREEFYDREIAPALKALAEKCEGADFSMIAVVEWQHGSTGSTMTVRTGSGIALKLVFWAAQASGNADKLIARMLQSAKEHGHNSVYLHMLELWAANGQSGFHVKHDVENAQ